MTYREKLLRQLEELEWAIMMAEQSDDRYHNSGRAREHDKQLYDLRQALRGAK